MEGIIDFISNHFIAGAILITLIIFIIVYRIMVYFGKRSGNVLPLNFAKRMQWPLLLFLFSMVIKAAPLRFVNDAGIVSFIHQLAVIGGIVSVTWMIIVFLKIIKQHIVAKYDVSVSDNLRARKVQTQYIVLENTLIFIVVMVAIGIALMSFNSIRNIGISVLTSAGIAGIIIGFAAQKALGTILAGIQIAITQPIRFDDVVIIDGEWGRIEEIKLTYVVDNIWDKRRLVVPSTYFLENVFQNWTRTQSGILGTVFIYTDYTVPLSPLREELKRLLTGSPLWDNDVGIIQVTEASEQTMELRVLVSARNSGEAFDLRAMVREGLIDFLQKEYPDALPKIRIVKNKIEEEKRND